jgi:hypothetical protein
MDVSPVIWHDEKKPGVGGKSRLSIYANPVYIFFPNFILYEIFVQVAGVKLFFFHPSSAKYQVYWLLILLDALAEEDAKLLTAAVSALVIIRINSSSFTNPLCLKVEMAACNETDNLSMASKSAPISAMELKSMGICVASSVTPNKMDVALEMALIRRLSYESAS